MRRPGTSRVCSSIAGIVLACHWFAASAEDQALLGRLVPEFEIISLDAPVMRYSPDLLMGTPYLIEFWATWCGYCLAEMDKLHQVHQEFQASGLQIISVSLDDAIGDVDLFRQERWPMPWIHANRTFDSDGSFTTRFGVNGVPSIYLVDGSGIVVAMDKQLRGARLAKTLRRLLPDR